MVLSALRRSFDVYYRDPARWERMHTLNAQFVPPGGLAFDIGAHVGDRTASFRQLGAKVVALEPQPKVFRALRLIHGRDAGVDLHNSAIGATAGALDMHINPSNPTVSTLSDAFVETAANAPGWRDETWDQRLRVPVTTLDALLADHGLPDFIKVDVEGFELEAFNGLSMPVSAVSFEVTTFQKDIALACIDRLSDLGAYTFNFSLGEDHKLQLEEWTDPATMRRILSALPDAANSGDVFAKRV